MEPDGIEAGRRAHLSARDNRRAPHELFGRVSGDSFPRMLHRYPAALLNTNTLKTNNTGMLHRQSAAFRAHYWAA